MTMREIKFRTWDAENKKLIYGDEIEEITVPHIEEGEHVCDLTRYYTGLSYGKLFVAYYNKRGDWNECHLMQFTGLLDKNGKEIYEGDILGYEKLDYPGAKDIQARVYWDGKLACFNAETQFRVEPLYYSVNFPCEVIGNIYENPELLGGGSECN